MKVFVATCDEYISALTPYAYLFNKFWSDDIEVTVLNRGTINEYELPKNFSIIALGSVAELYVIITRFITDG